MRIRPRLTALIACLLLPVAGVQPAAAADGDDYEQVVDITFPTVPPSDRTPFETIDGTSYGFIDDYDHARSNDCGIHRAIDILGAGGQTVHAAVGGEITWMPDPAPSYGWTIRIAGDDGRRYSYVHLGEQDGPREEAYAEGLDVGDRVERGQHIAYLGTSGNAPEDLPHLHFAIYDESVADSNEWGCPYINPYESLKDAIARGDVPGLEVDHVDRVWGDDRVGTAAALALDAFPDGADHAVVAAGWSFPDALVAGPLAAALDGPVIVTRAEALQAEAVEALEALGVRRVTVVDGAGALSEQVHDDLVEKAGLDPEAIDVLEAGNAFAVAAQVAAAVRERTGSDDVLVALGHHPEPHRSWPDALTASHQGAARGQPVLLVRHDEVPEATLEALEGVGTATIVGGAEAISEALEDEIAAVVGETRRLAGSNRYATAAAAAGDLLGAGLVDSHRLWAATGHDFADALAAATAVAAHGDLLVLVDGRDSGQDGPLADWIETHDGRFERGRIVGGPKAVSAAAHTRLAGWLR